MMKRPATLLCLVFLLLFPASVPALEDENPIGRIFRNEVHSIVVVGAIHNSKRNNKTGSGFIVSSNGLIVTNFHLIDKAKKVLIKLNNNEIHGKVRVIRVDAQRDLALIKIEGVKGLRPVKLGNSRQAQIGDRVVTIGNPLGLEKTIADGLISARRREENGMEMLQISVPLSSGSSGGPLFNLNGEVVGVTAASMAGGQNLNFAVPINYVKSLLVQSDYKSIAKSTAAPASKQLVKATPRQDVLPPVKQQETKAALSLNKDTGLHMYTVKPKDTLFGLARRFDTSVERLMKINALSSAELSVGQRIKIPQ